MAGAAGARAVFSPAPHAASSAETPTAAARERRASMRFSLCNMDGLETRLVELIRASELLVRALRAPRAVDPPACLIGPGAIRALVWDRFQGIAPPLPPKD